MTTAAIRPRLATLSNSRRPSSAIFLGSDPSYTPPDLPEPPRTPPSPPTSPGADEDIAMNPNKSGRGSLPSPPATNSTGSNGGDSTHSGSLPRRSITFTRPAMLMHPESPSRRRLAERDDNADVFGNDDDHTAKFINDKKRSTASDDSALQRIRDLNERSRQVISKFSNRTLRRETPSPSRSTPSRLAPLMRSPRRPPSDSASAAGSAGSRVSRLSNRQRAAVRHNSTQSGSETERESVHSDSRNLSLDGDGANDELATPQSAYHTGMHVRERRTSAPSPAKPDILAGLRTVRSRSTLRSRDTSPDAARRGTDRPSTSLSVTEDGVMGRRSTERYGATTAASSSRATAATTSARRTRQPLPRDFVDHPDSERSMILTDRSRSRISQRSISPEPETPPSATSAIRRLPGRASTVRERRNVGRWASEDAAGSAHSRSYIEEGEDDRSMLSTASSHTNKLPYGRRQALRGGSAESPLVGYALDRRDPAGEGPRSAGISARRRPVGEPGPSMHSSKPSISLVTSKRAIDSAAAGPSSALVLRETRTPASATSRRPLPQRSSVGSFASHTPSSRPSTSHAGYADGTIPNTASPAMRTHRSNLQLALHDGEWLDSPHRAQRELTSALRETAPTRSATSSRSSGKNPEPEHIRLLNNALERFESSAAHLVASSAPEVTGHAQSAVRIAETLHSLLQDAAEGALASHVDASVDPDAGGSTEEVWRHVHGQFRDGVRTMDDLVRDLTQVFLALTRLVRDASAGSSEVSSDGGREQQQHQQSFSLDDTVYQDRASSASGRRSTESGSASQSSGSRSSEYAQLSAVGAGKRPVLRSRGSDGDTPPARSRLSDGVKGRTSALSINPLRERGRDLPPARGSLDYDTPSKPSSSNDRPPSSIRRLLTSRDHESANVIHEPSSTTTRHAERGGARSASGNTSSLATGTRPAPLSESLITHPAADDESGGRLMHRRRISTATLNGPSPRQPTSKETVTPKLIRGDSRYSAKSHATTSRQSISALNELQMRDRSRPTSGEDALAQSPEVEHAMVARRRGAVRNSLPPPPRVIADEGEETARYETPSVAARRDRRRTVTEIFTRG